MASCPGFLVLEARFIAGRYGGAEWPPSPFRLLQAMVAGLRTVDDAGLRWLELQPPPTILAESAPALVQFKRSVPNNADPSKQNVGSTLRLVTVRRVAEPVRYVYALAEGEIPAVIHDVMQAAQAVHTLGAGEDMCAVNAFLSQLPVESTGVLQVWQPDVGTRGHAHRPGDAPLRVAVAGSLSSMEARYQSFQNRLDQSATGFGRPVLPAAIHAVVSYRTSAVQPRAAVVALRLVSPDGSERFARFHPENAVVVAGMLRHAAMRLAADGEHADFAAGYGPDNDKDCRMSWVPLPSVGHQHVDGMIRRGLFVVRAADQTRLQALMDGFSPKGVPLVDEQTGECVALAQAVDLNDEPVLGPYVAAATVWTSVTPVILPGDYGHNIRLLNRLLLKALREAGIDPGLLQSVEFSREGFRRHAVRIHDLRLKEWHAKRLILQHVRLTFKEAIRGPVVLGRGRHYGIGLCCANVE
jgi:CRISPR-associated protein Csb2